MVVMRDVLRKLGLNKYESDSYLNLLKVDSSSAYNLSTKSGVPFGRIYDSLKTLEQKGLIEIVPGKPKKYKAKDPKISIFGLIDEKTNELENLKQEINTAVANLGQKESSEDIVSITTGKTNFAHSVVEHLNYNTDLWATSESWKLDEWYPVVKKYNKKTRNPKYVLVDGNKINKAKINELKNQGIKVRDFSLEGVRLLVSDEELVTISIQDPKHEWVNINVHNKVLGKAMTKILKSIWTRSKEL